MGILCLDDDPEMRAVMRAAPARRGCRDIALANDGEGALALCGQRRFHLVSPLRMRLDLPRAGQRGDQQGAVSE